MTKICVSFLNIKDIEDFLSLHPEIQLIEVRMDMGQISDEDLARIFSLPVEIVATCRPNDFMSDQQRLSLLEKAILAGASYVDVEIESDFIKDILNDAGSHNCKTIISHHNFEGTPSYKELQDIISACLLYSPDIVKIASLVKNDNDMENLKRLYQDFHSIIAIGMGIKGVETRIHACDWGAPFTYAAANKNDPAAPGQIDYDVMKILCNV
ncbi:MAG: type I 3-dehydroquinate dehydratase [Bacteroidales bacterium]|jgi:3-dehydroquinate dehydratase type I|nr:type I 3-dehydroquinate dehydratase [Bacteroidales bacterium]